MRNKHATEDYFGECTIGNEMPPKEFEQRFCRVCKNQECARAGWGESQWVQRMSTQVDRLLDNPTFADPRDPQFNHIREHDFPDLLREAIRIEIVDQRNDWSIPSEIDVMTSVGAKGINAELTPSSTTQEENEGQKSNPEKPTQTIGSAQESDLNNSRNNLTSQQDTSDPQINSEQKKGVTLYTNTPFPKDGLMVDGSRPVKQTSPNPPHISPKGDPKVRQPSRFTLDDWSSPELTKPKNIVKKGARIQMSGTTPKPKGEE